MDRIEMLSRSLMVADAIGLQLVTLGMLAEEDDPEPRFVRGHFEADAHQLRHGLVTLHLLALAPTGEAMQVHVSVRIAHLGEDEGAVAPDVGLDERLLFELADQQDIPLGASFQDRAAAFVAAILKPAEGTS